MAVANYLKSCYDRIPLYALGYSMGGFYVVANLLNRGSNVFDKAILLNPVVNTQDLFSNKPLMDELWGYAKNLSLHKPDFYKREIVEINKSYNPIDIACWLKTPVSIVQSTADEVLDPAISKKFFDALSCKKEYFEIPNATHDLMGDEKELIQAIIE